MNESTKTGLYNALGIVAYVALVSVIMHNGERFFGEEDTYLTGIAFLSLFSLSAAVVGGLILGKPLMLYLDNKKKEGLALFLQTVGWLAAFTVILLISLVLLAQ